MCMHLVVAALVSTLLFLTHREAGRNRKIYDRCIAERVHLAFRRGMLRVAPHLYNTDRDIDRVLAVLHADSQ